MNPGYRSREQRVIRGDLLESSKGLLLSRAGQYPLRCALAQKLRRRAVHGWIPHSVSGGRLMGSGTGCSWEEAPGTGPVPASTVPFCLLGAAQTTCLPGCLSGGMHAYMGPSEGSHFS